MNIARIRPQRSQKHSHGTHTRPIWILKYIIIDVCPWNMVKFEYEFFFHSTSSSIGVRANEWKTLAHIDSIRKLEVIYYFYLLLFFLFLSLFASIFNSAFIVVSRDCALVNVCVCLPNKSRLNYTEPVAANQEWTRRSRKKHVVRNLRSLQIRKLLAFSALLSHDLLGSRRLFVLVYILSCVLLRTHGCRKSGSGDNMVI